MLKNFSPTLQSAHDKPANSKNVWIVSPSIWSSSSLKTRKISLWEKMFSPFIIPNKHRYYRVHNVGSLWWLNRTYCSKSEIEISWLQKPFFCSAIKHCNILRALTDSALISCHAWNFTMNLKNTVKLLRYVLLCV